MKKLSLALRKRIVVYRIAWIDSKIAMGHLPTAEELAIELEVSKRTIYRDIAFLREFMEVPVRWSDKRNGYYYDDEDKGLLSRTVRKKLIGRGVL